MALAKGSRLGLHPLLDVGFRRSTNIRITGRKEEESLIEVFALFHLSIAWLNHTANSGKWMDGFFKGSK
jgi:hypothetical protein